MDHSEIKSDNAVVNISAGESAEQDASVKASESKALSNQNPVFFCDFCALWCLTSNTPIGRVIRHSLARRAHVKQLSSIEVVLVPHIDYRWYEISIVDLCCDLYSGAED